MSENSRFSLKKVLSAFLLTGFFVLFWLAPFRIGDFYRYQDEYAGSVLRGDQTSARENLKKVEYFYSWNQTLRKFGLDGQANKHLFYNSPYFHSALDYLTGNYAKAAKELEEDSSFWALFIKGNVKWRLAQGMFRHALEVKDKTEAKKLAKEADDLAQSAKEEYEEAIKKDLRETLPPKWNYDLVTDQDARLAGLLPKPPTVKKVLGGREKGKIPANGGIPRPWDGGSEDLGKKEGPPQLKRGG